MLISDFAIVLNLMAIALLGFFFGAVLLSFAGFLLARFIGIYSIESQKVLIWLWLLGPWLVGLTTMLIFSPLFGNTVIYERIASIAHWHHLDVFLLNSWHGISLIFFVVFSLSLVAMKGWQVYRQSNALYSLKHFSSKQHTCVNTHRVLIIDSDIPTAFTSGLIKPICYVSRGLVDTLSSTELSIVIEHELAHVRAKDPLFMLIIACLSAYYPRKLALLLNAKYRLMSEHIADQSTTLQHSAEDVAATILKVVRLQKSLPAMQLNDFQSYFGANDITQRIHQLLQPTQKTIPLIIPIVGMFALLCITVVAVDTSHHLVESVFTHS